MAPIQTTATGIPPANLKDSPVGVLLQELLHAETTQDLLQLLVKANADLYFEEQVRSR